MSHGELYMYYCSYIIFWIVDIVLYRHGPKKIIDTTVSVRYSGLTNNTKLELIKCDQSRSEGLVTIGLQTEEGQRLLAEFQPTTTLWEMLQYYEKNQR